jgi:hypothetical protein
VKPLEGCFTEIRDLKAGAKGVVFVKTDGSNPIFVKSK